MLSSAQAHRLHVALVGGDELWREWITEFLVREPGLRIARRCGATARELRGLDGAGLAFDVVLLIDDDREPDVVERVRALLAASPTAEIVVLGGPDDHMTVYRAVAAGVRAYLSGSVRRDELLAVLRGIRQGDDRVTLSVARRAVCPPRPEPQIDGAMFTQREKDILRLIAGGMRSADAAARLFISEGTVKRHLSNVYAKLGVSTRTAAVSKLAQLGLLRETGPLPRPAGDPGDGTAAR